jgi:hypothetical protein
MTQRSQAGRRHGSQMPQTLDTDIHGPASKTQALVLR